MKFKKLYIILILILIYILFVSVSIYSYGNVYELRNADAAIVLGAATWGDKPSPVFEERIKHGIWLYVNGYVDKIIFTGGKGENEDISESAVAKHYAIEHSVPEKDIYIEEESTITQENIMFASEIARENNLSTVLLVSDPLHMKRAMLMAEDFGLEAYSSPTPTTMYQTTKSKFMFLSREVFYYIGYQMFRLF
ncbi:MAG: YdcF family protein [Sedimentibacter sp.]|nr:YdcF family protein [Sedimentibacter sp.]